MAVYINPEILDKHHILTKLTMTWSGIEKIAVKNSIDDVSYASIPITKSGRKLISLPLSKDWSELQVLGKHECAHFRFSNARVQKIYSATAADKYKLPESFVRLAVNLIEDYRCEVLFPKIFVGSRDDFIGYRRYLALLRDKDKKEAHASGTSIAKPVNFWREVLNNVYVGQFDLKDMIPNTSMPELVEMGTEFRKKITERPSWLVLKQCVDKLLSVVSLKYKEAQEKVEADNKCNKGIGDSTSGKDGDEESKLPNNQKEDRVNPFKEIVGLKGDEAEDISLTPDEASAILPSDDAVTEDGIKKEIKNIEKVIEKAKAKLGNLNHEKTGKFQKEDWREWNESIVDITPSYQPEIVQMKPLEASAHNLRGYMLQNHNDIIERNSAEIKMLRDKFKKMTTSSKYGSATSGRLSIAKAVSSVASKTYNSRMFKKRSIGRDVDVLLLIDQSGSMGGSCKIETAREAAVVMAESLKNLSGVKLCVQGHWVESRRWNSGGTAVVPYIHPTYKDFNDFDTVPIASMCSHGDNRDGLHIRLSTTHLLKNGRSSAKKVLVYLSDGLPNDGANNYRGRCALEDVRRATVGARRCGIVFIAVAIGVLGAKSGSKEDFEKMYGSDIVFVESDEQLKRAFNRIGELVVRLTN